MRAHGRSRRRAACATYLLPRAETSARWARHLTTAFLTRGCGEKLSGDQVEDATLVVSELVTNATRHGRSNCRLRLHVDPGLVTVEVQDASPVHPRLCSPLDLDEGGRGMVMVRELSQHVAVRGGRGGGKTVSAVLAAS
ncbi:anti-sigma regulatory factor (Ser/Thr protein kinase) [Streptomyces sp. SLBN-118]|uniref:ATP-binding protein n=1 Tax=Streptomyces sp. SLBN-118 TaxID=2768454 RepID=UPI001150D88D|nr:ATP-binding protein [Streptomyces sp. SLBN-118]TQK50614.1 anti-sigma regulatory factor (Ser/Thr protein kinase) [Streptomyces sp. SLBN-118]